MSSLWTSALVALVLLVISPAASYADGGLLRTTHALDEARGYCLDVTGPPENLRHDDPLQAHTCKYGAPLDDQRSNGLRTALSALRLPTAASRPLRSSRAPTSCSVSARQRPRSAGRCRSARPTSAFRARSWISSIASRRVENAQAPPGRCFEVGRGGEGGSPAVETQACVGSYG